MTSRSWKQFINKVGLGERQKELYSQFIDFHEEIGKELANIYLGAIKAISDTSNSDRFGQSAHSCRELMSVFKVKVFGLRKRIKNFKCPKCGFTWQETYSSYSISREDIENVLKSADPLKSPPRETIETLYKSWNKIYSYFSEIAHHERKSDPIKFSEKFEELEETFLILTKPSLDLFKEIDEILNKKPSKKVVREALKRLKNAVLADYFYKKAPSSWLNLLEKEEVFKNPPSPIIEDNTIRFPPWPQTKLLSKAAEKKPEKVMKIIESCKLPPDKKEWNIRVLIDFVEIALKMSSKIGKRIVNLVEKQKWLMCPFTFNSSLPNKLSDLMVKLAKESEIDSSLKLANILLDVNDAKPYIDTWEYEQILEKKVPVILERKPMETIEILAHKLNKAIYLENKAKDRKNDKNDYLNMWRPTIEENPQNWGHEDIKNYLVDSLRNSLEWIGGNNKKLLKDAIHILDKFQYPIFSRIKLHIYRLFSKWFKKEIQKAIEQHFDDLNVWHEYQLLVSQEFCSLPKELKEWYLQKIEQNSKKEKERKNQEAYQLERLQLIKHCLEGERKDKFEKLTKKYGEVEHPEFLIYHTSLVGPTSPLSIEELEKIFQNEGVEGIINYLKEWKPKTQMFGEPSSEGLERNLEELVKKYPQEFSKKSLLFWQNKVRPVYIYHLFSGLAQAIKEKKKINWDEVIELMVKITLEEDLYEYEKQDRLEPGWNSVFRVEIRLLNEGFSSLYSTIPFKKREKVWKVIETLSNHPEPDLEYEKKYGRDNMDPATLSINTIRGEAIHGVINYAFWCSRNLKKKILVKEAKKVLEEHLNIEKEKTLTIRAVYGWWLPILVYLDKNWVKKNLDKIFPKKKSLESFWLSAFETYLANSVYEDIFELLEKEYDKAISYLTHIKPKKKLFVNIDERLPEHLIIAYVYNICDKKIIDKFFSQAPISARSQALNFIGRVIFSKENLNKNKNKINFKRIQLLLEERLKNEEKEELKEFGWWFVSSPFEKKWNIEKLYEVLKITEGEIKWTHRVIEKLKEYVKIFPLLVVKSLFLIAEGDKKNWEVYYKKEEVRKIISALLESKNKKVSKEVKKLINKLVEKEFLEFKELLP